MSAEPRINPTDYVCCSKPMEWDADREGYTCGGLLLVGWMSCRVCGAGRLVSRHEDPITHSRIPDTSDRWEIAKGGRSVVCGAIKLRPEKGERAGIKAVLKRIARLPELEAEVERLRTQLGYPRLYQASTEPSADPEDATPDVP